MVTIKGPEKTPAGLQSMFVMYIGTFLFSSICRTGTPAVINACSKLNEQPNKKTENLKNH